MAMRMTGIISGMDTESIIKELVSVKQTKVDDTKKAQTKLQWKQDAWKSLNTKLRNLRDKYLNNLRYTSSYAKKTTTVSNSNLVSVITGEDAMNGVQNLEIKQLAKTGYLTGAKLQGASGKLTALSKLSDIAGSSITGDGTINLTVNGETKSITVNQDTTISDVLTEFKKAGLNANFDANNQRIFISSKESGEANNFSLTVSDAAGDSALSSLGLTVNLNQDTSALAEYTKYAGYYVSGDRTATLTNMRVMIDQTTSERVNGYLEDYKKLQASVKVSQNKIDEINTKYAESTLKTAAEYNTELDEKNKEINDLKAAMEGMDETQKAEAVANLENLNKEADQIKEKKEDATTLETQQTTLTNLNKLIDEVEEYITVTPNTVDGNTTYTAVAATKLQEEVENQYYAKAEYASSVMAAYDPTDTTSTGATKVTGQDAVIYLNGAEFTNNDNVFKINGLTFTALAETKAGESVTVTTQNDTNGIYDMIKGFLKEYNSIINEMDKLYNADSAKGYEPLTNDEKDSMSDKDIEEWEKKIKDSLLRRDSSLSSVSTALKEIMVSNITINGEDLHLSSFGINTLSYFTAAENEKNAYHIDGDPDDNDTSANADKLKGMIANDPDKVIDFFSQLSKNLYSKMNDLSKSAEGYRSFGNFYDDKKMNSDYSDYKDKIKDLEQKLTEYEDKWYKKFSAMETALAKMQSNSSAVTSLLGGS